MRTITIPISDEVIRSLQVGESVALQGVLVTGRDRVHQWLAETFIRRTSLPQGDDQEVYAVLRSLLNGGVIYHCGPVVVGSSRSPYQVVAAGPTTSIREEPYQAEIMKHFNVKGVLGKGGMGTKTLRACQEVPGVYFHAVGGAATYIAQSVKRVLGVYKLDFGVPEAIWVLEVQDLPVVVTMDARGNNLHEQIAQASKARLEELIQGS